MRILELVEYSSGAKMFNYQLLIAGFLILVFGTVNAQNLISNASFEKCNHCPKRLGSFHNNVVAWKSPTLGSTDYFNGCSNSMGTPENFNGTQIAENGSAYAGFYLYAPEDYREYIQTELLGPLQKGEEYQLVFYLSRAENADFAIKDIGVLFSDSELTVNTKKALTKRHWYANGAAKYNYLEIEGDAYWLNTIDWIRLEVSFVAKGFEQYVVIGNFNGNSRTRVKKTLRNARKGAYYYIDGLSLSAQSGDVVVQQDLAGLDLEGAVALNTNHRFQNVLFEFDRSMLLDTAKADIEKVYRYLQNNGNIKIHIEGHTDNIGTELYNRSLSDNRCKAVVNYLMELGLAEDRISWRAHGGTQPIAGNDTDEGRKLNRRVEFMLVQKEMTQ